MNEVGRAVQGVKEAKQTQRTQKKTADVLAERMEIAARKEVKITGE